VEAERGRVVGVDAADHDVLAHAAGERDQRLDSRPPTPAPVRPTSL
jgi:hypothetical protein